MKSCNMYFVAIILSKWQCKISNRKIMLVEANTATQFSVLNFFFPNISIRAFLFPRLIIDNPLLRRNSDCIYWTGNDNSVSSPLCILWQLHSAIRKIYAYSASFRETHLHIYKGGLRGQPCSLRVLLGSCGSLGCPLAARSLLISHGALRGAQLGLCQQPVCGAAGTKLR